jgi:uncharacterized protein YndB with AHSA1/START domain
MNPAPGALVMRRSMFIRATPERIWQEVESYERFAAWWGVDTETLKTKILRWEPRVGGWFENQGTHSGAPINFKGQIVTCDPPRELTVDWNSFLPEYEWHEPTYVTVRLTPAPGGTVVEILQHGFEWCGEGAAQYHRDAEGGWDTMELEVLRSIVEADAA